MKTENQSASGKKKEFPIWITVIVVFGCGAVANFLGDMVFVCLVYGRDTYFKQGVYIAKHKPYTLSNGILVGNNLGAVGWAINGLMWFACIFLTMLILTRLHERFQRGRKPRPVA